MACEKKIFILAHDQARRNAAQYCMDAPLGYVVRITPPTRSLEMNAKFHAICGDIEKSNLQWCGKKRAAAQWKVLLVSGHAVATKEGAEMVPGIESEFVNLRESTALMSKKRGASLIEYAICFCAQNGVKLSNDSLML